ncbi:DgyrCDS3078 [Dimorphilus gyrociliatus]|uniref:DgyrCDS3078 n=1 Tax=Dimorphilus gyrociliatus TaxID=2664684 RepID=A0A7I8VC46_9ANNE|nr:DgyrCDS3078 [Dimorphilus gyrociliatus]
MYEWNKKHLKRNGSLRRSSTRSPYIPQVEDEHGRIRLAIDNYKPFINYNDYANEADRLIGEASAKIKEAGEDIFSDLVYLQKVLNLESLDQLRQCSDLLLDHFMEYSTRIKSVLIEPKPSEIQKQLINCNTEIATILRISDFVGFLGSRGEDYQTIGNLCMTLKERMEKLEVQINDYLYGLSNSMEVPTRQLRKTSSDSATRRRSLNEIDLNPLPVPSALNLHNNTDIPPPLPEKLKTPKALDDHSPAKSIESAYRTEPRRLSYYDNLPSIDGNSSESTPPPLPPKKGKSQEESHYDNMKLREKTSADLIPPLPPKHAIQAYLNAFGSYTLPQNHELARHSVHAVNYYKQNWYEHQMLVHSPNTDSFLPIKSKTISQMTCLREERKRSSDRRTFVQESKISDESEEDSSEDVQETPAVTVQIEKEKMEDQYKKNSADLVSNLYPDDAQIILDELIFKKKESKEGCEIKGGSVEALLTYATTSGNKDFMYQEAFLTTYRTFASTEDLIDKLISRYKKFSHMDDWKKLSRNVFSFIIRVLDELSMTELDENLFIQLMNVVHTIISDGDLSLGRVFRKQLLNKARATKEKKLALAKSLLKKNVREYNHKITQFKAVDIAEQMTLIDSDIFNKIELAEVLLWSRHNKEDQEENFVTLMKCVHTFNNISYWCRSRIVDVHDTKEREKCYYKFIKVLKHLRRLNNFNGCMAIYSALNANVISRLEWPKQTLEV